MILEAAVVVAVGYAIYKHIGLATIESDVQSAVAKVKAAVAAAPTTGTAIVTSLENDLKNYL